MHGVSAERKYSLEAYKTMFYLFILEIFKLLFFFFTLDSQEGEGLLHVLKEGVWPLKPISLHTSIVCGSSRLKRSLPDSEMGFDAWSLTSQETSLITEVFVDEVLQLPLFLNTGGFFREGIERWVSLGKSHNHQVTETLTSSLYSNVFSLNTVCIEKKTPPFSFLFCWTRILAQFLQTSTQLIYLAAYPSSLAVTVVSNHGQQ